MRTNQIFTQEKKEMQLPGGFEWIVILIIVVLVFGVGRISKISGEIGSSIRAFREGVQGDQAKKDKKAAEEKLAAEEKKES
jgi:sec-independent protein translocase protein TatA